jgi:predicted MPP superfamily phosphohydrolase
MRRLGLALLLWIVVVGSVGPASQEALPTRPGSVKFAALGDSGTGGRAQYDVGDQLASARAQFPFQLVIMLGDNVYGRQQPEDFVTKFERPYAALLSAGVGFYASLGNHDDPANTRYAGFHMSGARYYTYARNNVRFLALDSNLMDPAQLAWIDNTLKQSQDDWKICYFHHPIYSNSGRHGSNVQLRVALEPLFVKYGVNVVFSGHDHVYERLKPQKGVAYFVAGAGGQLAKGDVNPSDATAAYFDQDQSFMLLEVAGDELFFRAVSRTGRTVDSGVIRRQTTKATETL